MAHFLISLEATQPALAFITVAGLGSNIRSWLPGRQPCHQLKDVFLPVEINSIFSDSIPAMGKEDFSITLSKEFYSWGTHFSHQHGRLSIVLWKVRWGGDSALVLAACIAPFLLPNSNPGCRKYGIHRSKTKSWQKGNLLRDSGLRHALSKALSFPLDDLSSNLPSFWQFLEESFERVLCSYSHILRNSLCRWEKHLSIHVCCCLFTA